MNPATFRPPTRTPRPAGLPYPGIDDLDASADKLFPASHAFLEPGNEGLVFAGICLLCSAVVYVSVLLIR